MIGVKDNHGFKKLLTAYGGNGKYSEEGERQMIKDFFEIIHQLEPTIIIGYNSENFDWTYLIGRNEETRIRNKIQKKLIPGRVQLIGLELDKISKTKQQMINMTRKK